MRTGVFQCAAGGKTLCERLDSLSTAINGHENDLCEKLDLVVCPELFSSGYHIGDALITKAAEYSVAPFSAIAQKHDVALCYGYPQKAGDTLRNAAAFVGADGQLMANHHKQLNSPGSFEEDYFTPGGKATSLTYLGIHIAILICYEVEFPESVRNAAVAGAHLVLVPTALAAQWDIVASQVVPTRAFENGVWIACANHAGHENGLDYLGGSKIVAPDGEITADAGTEEGLVSADIDLDKLNAAQARLPYLRDFGELIVNR